MKITLLSTSDRAGGAAIACMRLAEALSQAGHLVRVVVVERSSQHPLVVEGAPGREKLDQLLKQAQYHWNKRFTVSKGFEYSGEPWLEHFIHQHPAVVDADVLNLHWINHGFLGIKALQQLFLLRKPIFWHLHDFWPATGGCHYPSECEKFLSACQFCPALKNPGQADLSSVQFTDKLNLYKTNPPTFVGASAWLASQVQQSALVQQSGAKVLHIPNPIDPHFYTPADKQQVRNQMGLDPAKKYLLFAAMNAADPRKGFVHLREALHQLDKELVPAVELLVAGKAQPNLAKELPFKTHLLGSLNAEKMRQAYQAADVFIIPSLQENLPNTILESLFCGTLVAGFETGGIPEMVKTGKTGFLASSGDSAGLAKAIHSAIHHPPFAGELPAYLAAYLPQSVSEKYTQAMLATLG